MSKNLLKYLKILILSAVPLLFAGLTGCSQSAPELTIANYSVIFEYEDNETLPSSRLCIFMESDSDVNRYDRIQIQSLDNGYIWDFKDFSKIILNERQWAGNTNLVVPEDEIIPTGNYEVTYFNADEKETKVYVTVSYDTSIYDLLSDELETKMKNNGAIKKIAVYDNNDVLLYYGEKTIDFMTPRGIWNQYRTASYYYDIWCTSGDFVICIMPQQKVALENN